MSNTELTKQEKQLVREKNIRLVKLFFQVLAYLASIVFIGLIITMAVVYGIDATSNEIFGAVGGKTIGIIGIPLFSVVLLASFVVGIINLRDSTLETEEELKEFKLVEQLEEKKNE